jgi:hypothetical protein
MNMTYSFPLVQHKKVFAFSGEKAIKIYLYAALIICINLFAML